MLENENMILTPG